MVPEIALTLEQNNMDPSCLRNGTGRIAVSEMEKAVKKMIVGDDDFQTTLLIKHQRPYIFVPNTTENGYQITDVAITCRRQQQSY